MTQTVILASGNPGKLNEMNQLLATCGLTVKPQSDFDVTDADETGLTFIENSIIKARHAASITGLPALADDSGLEVDALSGAPGIYSARYATQHDRPAGDVSNYELLLEQLDGLPTEQRTARFRCVVVLMRHATDPAPLIAQGTWEGRILTEPDGVGGFGYDPVFYSPERGCAAACLDKATKNSLSHRGKALASLTSQLTDIHW